MIQEGVARQPDRPTACVAASCREVLLMLDRSMWWIATLAILFTVGTMYADNAGPIRVAVSSLNDHLFRITCTAGEEFGLPPFGTNLVASVSPDGMLLIDAGFASTGAELADTLKRLYDGPRKIIVNTHGHGDHAGGNVNFPDAVIMGHRNTVDQMSGNYYHLPGKPSPSRPTVGFGDTLIMHINGEEVRIIHAPKCHTGGDVYVYFVGSKIVAVGDLIFSDEFPYVDLYAGGSVAGYIAQIQKFIDDFPDDVTFIAAHGRSYTKSDLIEYEHMLAGTTELIRQAAAEGKTARQMAEDSLLADWEDWIGSFATTSMSAWIGTVYQELTDTNMRKPSICEPLTAKLVAGTADDAVGEYHRLKSTAAGTYNFGEAQLNMLGYQLLFRNRVDDALRMFRLNIDAYPESFNVYDSYGEALLASGDTANAIINYEKSLELNPDNTNATAVLGKLK